jgi:5-methyltetrahydropteroyltriglutamate--homocysteine methyltransferase
MASYFAGLTGPFPRSEALVEVTRRKDRGLETEAAVRARYDAESERVTRREIELGFDWVTGGLLPWQDLFRPWIERTENLETGALSRWFETNTFFRPPRITGTLSPKGGTLLSSLPDLTPWAPGRPRAWIFPGPWTFANLCEDPKSRPLPALAALWAGRLAQEVGALERDGASHLLLLEPCLVTHPPRASDQPGLERAYRPLRSILGRELNGIWTFFGDAAQVLPFLARLPASVLGCDLTVTEPPRLRSFPKDKTLGLGILDPWTSLPEDLGELLRLVRGLDRRLGPKGIFLGPAASLDLLTAEAAERKLTVLARARETLLAGRTKPAPKPPARSARGSRSRRKGRP